MPIIESILFTVVAICALLFFRNLLVFRIRMKAMDIIHKENERRIGGTEPMLDYPILREIRGTGLTYHGMMFNLLGWTMGYFYPDVIELQKRDGR